MRCDMGSRRVIRQLEKEKIACPTGGSWNLDFVQNTLKNRAVIGEYQPYTGDCHNREPVGDAIPGYYPQTVTQEVFDAVQAATAARNGNPRTGKIRAGRGGGRVNPNNLFGTLLHDKSIDSKSGELDTMYYRVEKSNGHMINGQPKGKRPAYYTPIVVHKRFCHRVQYLEFEEAFLPFLKEEDFQAVFHKGQSEVVAKARKPLDEKVTELARSKQQIAKYEAMEAAEPKPDIAMMIMEKLLVERKKNKTLQAQEKELRSKFNSVQTEFEQLVNVKELHYLLRKGALTPVEKMQLHAEIVKRVKRVDLDFRIDPKLGKIITADVTFINKVREEQAFTIHSDQHIAYLFEKENGKRYGKKIKLTPEIHRKRKVTDEIAFEIHRLHWEKGMSAPQIGRLKDLGATTVRRILRGARNVGVFKKLFPNETPMLEKSRSKYANGKLLDNVEFDPIFPFWHRHVLVTFVHLDHPLPTLFGTERWYPRMRLPGF